MRRGIAAVSALVLAASTAPGHLQAEQVTVAATVGEVRAERPIAISDLVRLRDLGGISDGLSLSPDQMAVAFQTRQMNVETNGHRIDWWVLPVSGGSPTRVGDGGELMVDVLDIGVSTGTPIASPARWSPNGQWLVYLRKNAGEVQIWRSQRDGGVQEQLTHSESDIDRFAWTADGSRVLFTVKATRSDLRLAEKRAREEGFLWNEDFYPIYGWMPKSPARGDGVVWVVDIASKAERTATDAEASAFRMATDAPRLAARPLARTVVASDKGNWVASVERLNPDLQGHRAPLTVVVSRAPRGLSPIVCPAGTCTGNITSIWWHPRGDRVYFLRREGHGDSRRAIYEWRVGSRTTRQIYATDDWVGDDCRIVKERAICLHESLTRPRALAAIDLKTGSLTTLFDPNPEFKAIEFTKLERLEWQDRYGNDTFGHLVYPKGYEPGQRYPLVIVQYRSQGFLRGGVGGEYPIHVLAAQGFFVLSWDKPSFRAIHAKLPLSESQKYVYSENREHVSKQSALEILLDALTARGLIDPTRVGITGLSDGAETTFVGLIHSKRFAAAAVSSPPDDPVGYYLQSARYTEIFAQVLGVVAPSEAEESRRFWNYVSFALNVDKLDAPILMNLADAEAGKAMQAVAALRDARKPFEVHVYPGEFHVKNQPKALLSILQRNVDWFNFWLREVEDSVPEKTEQYARWRKLRALKGSSNPEPIEPRAQLLH